MLKNLVLSLILLLMSSASFAIDISDAKEKGLIGELPNGYLGIVTSNPDKDIQALVDDINAKRKAAYQSLANDEDLTLQQVEKISGVRNLKRTESGHYIFVEGKWIKK